MRVVDFGKVRVIMLALVICLAVTAAVGVSSKVSAAETYNEPVLTFVYGGKNYEYRECELVPADFTVSEDFQKRMLSKPISERMKLIDRLLVSGSEVKDAMLYCFPLMSKTINAATTDISCAAVDAEIRFYPERNPMFEIKRSSPGYKLNESRIYDDAYFALKRGLKRVALAVEIIEPKTTAEELSKYTRLRASFTTSYSSSSDERKHNVELALSKVNGKTLEKGEEFSFNGTVGRRTQANGFMPAKIIVGGKYTEGVGGGVCQVSTTVYNCALRAGLKITKVNRHSLVPSYVPPSFDAMVNASSSDLRFVNDTDGPLFIRANGTNGVARVEIFSSSLPYEIECRSETISIGDRPDDEEFIDINHKYTEGMESGVKVKVSGGAPAVESKGYLIKRWHNGQTEEVLIRHDKYAESAATVAVAP